jgi:hypothetical protein
MLCEALCGLPHLVVVVMYVQADVMFSAYEPAMVSAFA